MVVHSRTVSLVVVHSRTISLVVVHSHTISLVVIHKHTIRVVVHSNYTAVAEGQEGLVTTNNHRVKVVMVLITVEHDGMVARGTSSVTNVEDLVTTLESAQMGPVSRKWRWTIMTMCQ